MDSSSTIMESEYADMMDETSDTLSDVGDGEISVIDYARYYGLSKDYTSVYPLSPHILHSIPRWDDPNLELAQRPEFELPTELDLEEKWTIDHQSALFLRQMTSTEDAPFTAATRQKSKSADFKVEPLLLPADPELEQRKFMRARHSRQHKDAPEGPTETFWQDNEGAALYWPDLKLPETIIERIKQEKLQLDKNDILFLQQCISFADEPEAQELDIPSHKKARKEYEEARHTSPLLPCSSPFQFSVPDSPVSRVPLATSPIDPMPAEIKRIEDFMDIDDEFSLDGLSDISAFDIESPNEIHSHTPLKRRRPDDYKVEVPLSPALQSSPMKKLKTVTFSDELRIDIPEYAEPFPSEDSNGTDDIRNFLEQVIEPGAKSALLAISGEQLSQADSILRVEVPVIDQRGPLPPWKLFARKQLGYQTELEAQQQLISMLKRETIKPREHWHGIGEVDDTMSYWRPFDMHLSDLPEEEIQCDALSVFNPGEKPEDTTSGWKLDGLRTLDSCEDDDEEIDNYLRHDEDPIATQSPMPSTFSVSNSLHRFMQTYTGKACGEKPGPQTQAVVEKVERPTSNHSGEATRSMTIHHPSLPTTVPLRTFVLSSTMFERRKLVKEIERLNAKSEYIERDFTSPRILCDEADIIIAPGHGIMLTTLQKIMQKSLPGEVVRNVIRERIVQLARRYERLIIMVHEDRSSDQQRPLDSRESGELVSLINFCAAQSHNIQVMYIPGDELALATWIVASMIRYGLDDPEVHLLQDETSWELFLRKAGMDAFAAQAVLNKLKAPDPMPTPSDERYYGLPAFVMMDEAERLRLFGALFGGEKILRKVSMAIDGCWRRNVVAGDLER
ncbi:hypothetical protein KCU95_g17210, partial [Aureobasidium melanogenum]